MNDIANNIYRSSTCPSVLKKKYRENILSYLIYIYALCKDRCYNRKLLISFRGNIFIYCADRDLIDSTRCLETGSNIACPWDFSSTQLSHK